MPKAELGTKRICPVTGKKFYDLGRDPIVSPFTGQSYPRSHFDPQPKFAKADPVDDEDEVADDAAAPEIVSLDDAESDDKVKVPGEEDIDIDDDDDDTFLEAEEDEDDADVSDLIDGDLDEDEES